MKKVFISMLVALLPGLGKAQDYKVAKSTGRLELQIGRATVEGYNGNEIVFSSRDGDKKKDERAAGLKEVSGLGIEDNTNLGINVETKGDVVTVRQLRRTNSP